jgi:hypothetical protein
LGDDEPVRAGTARQEPAAPFRQKVHDLAAGSTSPTLSDAIETLDGPAAR